MKTSNKVLFLYMPSCSFIYFLGVVLADFDVFV